MDDELKRMLSDLARARHEFCRECSQICLGWAEPAEDEDVANIIHRDKEFGAYFSQL